MAAAPPRLLDGVLTWSSFEAASSSPQGSFVIQQKARIAGVLNALGSG